MTVDRRVTRTRAALYDALVTLILAKDYDAISVQEILEQANVGRSTFYSHFTSKDDLLKQSLSRLRALLHEQHRIDRAAPPETQDDPWRFSRTVFEHVDQYRPVYFTLVGSHAGTIVLKALRDVFAEFASERPVRDEGLPDELVARHAADTLITVITWWLDRNPALAPRDVDAMFRRLLAGIAPDG